jgi:hypothetical protein
MVYQSNAAFDNILKPVNKKHERAIRWLIALMVLCCDLLAVAHIAAVSA